MSFYGLAQAGRAICAARLEGDLWRPQHSHGLSFEMTMPAQDAMPTLSSVKVIPKVGGHVQQVAAAINSPVLARPVTLAELLSALDVELYFDDEDLTGARPLEVFENGMLLWAPGKPPQKSLQVGPLPVELAGRTEGIPVGPHNLAHTRHLPPNSTEIAAWLAPYPRLASLGPPDAIDSPESADHFLERGNWAIRLGWDGPTTETTQTQWTVNQLDVVYSAGSGNGHGVVLPAIGGNEIPQKPLITWWLALYALSMLARYQPREWTAMIDVDRSRLAVPLEQLLARTTSELLELVVDAL